MMYKTSLVFQLGMTILSSFLILSQKTRSTLPLPPYTLKVRTHGPLCLEKSSYPLGSSVAVVASTLTAGVCNVLITLLLDGE